MNATATQVIIFNVYGVAEALSTDRLPAASTVDGATPEAGPQHVDRRASTRHSGYGVN